MELLRLIFGVAAATIAVGLILEIFVPGGGHIVDIGGAIFAVATWVVPPLRLVLAGNRKRTSLQSVGLTIHVLALAACGSVIGLWLAFLTLIFAHDGDWAWRTILAIVAFWAAGILALNIENRRERPNNTPRP